jgi:hypothetical protein
MSNPKSSNFYTENVNNLSCENKKKLIWMVNVLKFKKHLLVYESVLNIYYCPLCGVIFGTPGYCHRCQYYATQEDEKWNTAKILVDLHFGNRDDQ